MTSRWAPLVLLVACEGTDPKRAEDQRSTGEVDSAGTVDGGSACRDGTAGLSGTVRLDWAPQPESVIHVLLDDGGALPIQVLVESDGSWAVRVPEGEWMVWATVDSCISPQIEVSVEGCTETVQDLAISESNCMLGSLGRGGMAPGTRESVCAKTRETQPSAGISTHLRFHLAPAS